MHKHKIASLFICLLFTVPCVAKVITVEAPEPVSLTIEADDFSAGTDISTYFDDITLSGNGGPVYAVTSTKANGHLGDRVIGHSGGELWGAAQQFRIDFNGLAKNVSIKVIASSDSTAYVTAYMEAYDSVGELIDSDEKTNIYKFSTVTFNIDRGDFDIDYVIVYADIPGRYMCLDEVNVNFLTDYLMWADFSRIQDAIDYGAVDGDIIEVWPGNYYERIEFFGLAVTVTSTDPEDPDIVASTVIDAMGGNVGVRFNHLEISSSVLTGLTIQDANDGIYCYYSDPLITNCVIKDNAGAGINCDSSSPTIEKCFIKKNKGSGIIGTEGAISTPSYPRITDCNIVENSGNGVTGGDGFIKSCIISNNKENGLESFSGFVENCIISGNSKDGILSGDVDSDEVPEYPAVIANCTIIGNKGSGVSGVVLTLNNNIIVNNFSSGLKGVLGSGFTYERGVTYHAVVCGIEDYQYIEDAPYADRSALGFYYALLRPNWDAHKITFLGNSDATKSAIQTAIQNMASAAEPNDVCVFFFAGHGTTGRDVPPYDEIDGHDEYLCPHDFDTSNSGRPINGISDDELGEWLAALPTNKYVAFIEACHSGGMIESAESTYGKALGKVMGVGNFVPMKGDGFATDLMRKMKSKVKTLKKLSAGSGDVESYDLDDNGCGVVITACDEDEVCYASSGLGSGSGVFTYYLLEGMSDPNLSADTDNPDRVWGNNRRFSGEECYEYVEPLATKWAKDNKLEGQHAQIYDGHPGELEFVVLDVNDIIMDAFGYNNIWSNQNGSYDNTIPNSTDIHKDPRFAVEGDWAGGVWVEGDYHLRSSAGRWAPELGDWVTDNVNSPCIDAGDPEYPVGSELNPNGARVNMGAYGGTTQAGKSPSGVVEPVCSGRPAMDFNGDCKVDLVDFATFIRSWLECNMDPQEVCWE